MRPSHAKLARGSIAHKDYTGQVVVVHPVQEGESLSRIAAVYGLSDWRPIWTYNTKVEKTLGDDPALVRKGVSIFIPRSAAGYDRLIAKLDACKLGLAAALDSTGDELEGLAFERDAYKTMIDGVGDAATVVVGFGVMAWRAAKAATAARGTVGQARIASKLSARAETRTWVELYAKRRGELTRKALAQTKDASAKQALRTDFVKGKSIDAASKLVDAARQARLGNDEEAAKHLKNAKAVDDLRKQAGSGKLTVGQGALDVLGIALDYLSVSAACEAWIWAAGGGFWGGETFSGVQKQVLGNAVATTAAMAQHLDERIAALDAEKRLLYG